MSYTRARYFVCRALPLLSLAACGGGIDATIGGNISGLATGSTVVLQNNSSDALTLTSNGPFTFATGLTSGEIYSVSVLTQPVGQTCSVANGSGTADSIGDPVTNVAVTCANSSSLGGTVSGLPAGTSVTLSNGGVLLPVAANGAFAFPGILTPGSTYNVIVATQPAGHTCSVSASSGTIVANVIASVAVNCF
jgi:hypothetical protein